MAKKKVVKKKTVGIKISKIEMVPIGKIIPHPKNPNIHTDKQIEDLADLIREHGFDTALVVSTKSGFLIKGEGRWKAAQLLGMATVPVSRREYENDAKEYAAMVSDNEIGKASRVDHDMVKLEIKALKINPNALGIDDITKFIDVKGHQRNYGDKNKEIETNDFGNDLTHKCPKCGFEYNE